MDAHLPSSKVTSAAATAAVLPDLPDPPQTPAPDQSDTMAEPQGGIFLDDASRMSRRQVQRYIEARSEADVLEAFQLAKSLGIPITARGKAHAMGGHSMGPGLVLSLRHMQSVHVDLEKNQLTAQAGATWAEILQTANAHARSVPTLQSYAGFSLGGSIAINIHGVSSDATLAESILSLRVLTADGRILECPHPDLQDDADCEAAVLFRHVVGGLGLFGIVLSATLRMCDNVLLDADAMLLTPSEFDHVHTQVREAPDVELKLARLDITSMDSIQLFVFRRASGPTVSPLPTVPRAAGPIARLIFKWLAPTALEMRFALERQLGGALDWSNDVLQRNLLLYESVDPLAVLFNPLLAVDDTFVLQEYFVPRLGFADWIQGAKAVYNDILLDKEVWLLNTTVRFVKQDRCTALPYAAAEGGMYAFVLYFRLRREPAAEAQLACFHNRLVRLTLGLQGRPYLAYRHHFTDKELHEAYPEFRAFCAAKHKLDPHMRFNNTWYERYGVTEAGAGSASTLTHAVDINALFCVPMSDTDKSGPFSIRQTEERHEGSFRAVLADMHLRKHFREHFLKDIFKVKEPAALYSLVAQATWDGRNATDADIYIALQQLLSRSRGLVASVLEGWHGLKQLSAQKEELVNELEHLLSMVGKAKGLYGYVSIGDHGKLVLPIRAKLGVSGPVFILHESCSEDIPAVLERGSLEAPGTFITFNPETLYGMAEVPAASVDLVTMMQGLHHLPQAALTPFLQHVGRILRPGGLFVFREHDLDTEVHPKLRPMLDVAHMVFNAVTGVSLADEKSERRGFRSVAEWRQIAAAHGLVDTRVYAMQENDPTFDEMIVCFKPPFSTAALEQTHSAPSVVPKTPASTMPVVLPKASAVIRTAPALAFEILRSGLESLRVGLPDLSEFLRRQMSGLSQNQQLVLQQVLSQYVQPLERFLARFEPLLVQSADALRNADQGGDESADMFGFLPAELGLIAPALLKKVEQGNASPLECTAAALVKDLEKIFTFQPGSGGSTDASRTAPTAHDGQRASGAASTTAVPSVSPSAAVTETLIEVTEVAALLEQLVEAFPVLGTPEAIENFGMPRLLQRAANAYYENMTADQRAAGVRQTVAHRLASALDASSWEKLRRAVQGAVEAGHAPTWSALLEEGAEGHSYWHQALCALFESPRFRLPAQARGATARFLGCGPIVTLWEKVRRRRAAEVAAARTVESDNGDLQEGTSATRTPALPRPVADAMAQLLLQEQPREETLNAPFRSISNIRRLVSVRFGYTSLTASKVDVTAYANEHWLVGSTLQLDAVDVLAELRAAGLWTGQTYDSFRMRMVGKSHKLHVMFLPLGGEDELAHCHSLSTALRDACLTDAEHADDGHYTWFKLVEWMQVDILQVFGASLEHTPWYRLPLLGFMRRYFSVFGKVLKIVREKHGLGPAYFSTAMLTDLVPGMVMTGVFGQLSLLALPVRLMYGESYETDTMVEELVVLDRGAVPRLASCEVLNSVAVSVQLIAPRLIRLKVPTFKGLTTAVLELSRRAPHLQLLDISGQREVQVKVEASGGPAAADMEKARLKHEDGVQVMFSYAFPVAASGGEPPTQISLSVAVPRLCNVVRYVDSRPALAVAQIYDFWR